MTFRRPSGLRRRTRIAAPDEARQLLPERLRRSAAAVGGTQAFSLSFSGGASAALSAGVQSYGSSAFYDPGLGIGQNLFQGADVYRGSGFTSGIVNGTSPGGDTTTVPGCGHDINCALANSPGLKKLLENAGPCVKPTIYVRGGWYAPIFFGHGWNEFDYLFSPDGSSFGWSSITISVNPPTDKED
jgi:hypothetical protein